MSSKVKVPSATRRSRQTTKTDSELIEHESASEEENETDPLLPKKVHNKYYTRITLPVSSIFYQKSQSSPSTKPKKTKSLMSAAELVSTPEPVFGDPALVPSDALSITMTNEQSLFAPSPPKLNLDG